MRLHARLLATLAFLAVAAAGGTARAQFANHSIGFEAGYVHVANPAEQNIGSGIDFGLNSTLYVENGFDLYFRILAGIHKEPINDSNVVGVVPAFGFRYLLSEDYLRPYLGLSAAYLAIFGDQFSSHFAVTPMGGIELFVSENFSVGPQAEYHLILSLNDAPEHAVVGLFRFNWYF